MAFPLYDDNTDRKSFPYVTIALIVVNVFVFVVLQGLGGNDKFTYAYATVPAEIVQREDIETPSEDVQMKGPDGKSVTVRRPGLEPTPIPVYLTLITAMFMHGSLMHLGGNMWFLWIFGDNLEDDLGKPGYVAFYLVCGVIAGLAHVLMNTVGDNALVPCLGASGAISGVMGGYLVLHPHRRVTVLLFRFLTQVPGWVAVGIWFAFQVINSWVDTENGIAYAAHIGGFIAGAAIGGAFFLVRHPRQSTKEWEQVTRKREF